MTREEELLRAKRVRLLLNNEDVQTAIHDVEASILQDIRQTAWDESSKREMLHADIRALDRLVTRLRVWVEELDK